MTGNYPQEKIIHEPTGLEHWEEMEAVGGNSLSTLNKVGFGRVLDLMLNFLSAHFCLSRQPVSLRAMTWGWDGEFSYSNPLFACQLPEEVLSGTADFHHSHEKKKKTQKVVWPWGHIPQGIKMHLRGQCYLPWTFWVDAFKLCTFKFILQKLYLSKLMCSHFNTKMMLDTLLFIHGYLLICYWFVFNLL